MNKSMKRSTINDNNWYKSMLAGNRSDLLSDYELIATAFGTGSSGTITFSSIPADYKHLQLRFVGKSDNDGAAGILLRFNGISTNVYAVHSLFGNTTNPGNLASANQSSIAFTDALSRPSVANAVGSGIIDILDYASTTKFKNVRGLHGVTAPASRVALTNGLWRSTAAITSLTITNPDISFTSISRFSIYGIRG